MAARSRRASSPATPTRESSQATLRPAPNRLRSAFPDGTLGDVSSPPTTGQAPTAIESRSKRRESRSRSGTAAGRGSTSIIESRAVPRSSPSDASEVPFLAADSYVQAHFRAELGDGGRLTLLEPPSYRFDIRPDDFQKEYPLPTVAMLEAAAADDQLVRDALSYADGIGAAHEIHGLRALAAFEREPTGARADAVVRTCATLPMSRAALQIVDKAKWGIYSDQPEDFAPGSGRTPPPARPVWRPASGARRGSRERRAARNDRSGPTEGSVEEFKMGPGDTPANGTDERSCPCWRGWRRRPFEFAQRPAETRTGRRRACPAPAEARERCSGPSCAASARLAQQADGCVRHDRTASCHDRMRLTRSPDPSR